jgi:hypothetical protein
MSDKATGTSKPSERVLGEQSSICHIIYDAISLVEDFVIGCVNQPWCLDNDIQNHLVIAPIKFLI